MEGIFLFSTILAAIVAGQLAITALGFIVPWRAESIGRRALSGHAKYVRDRQTVIASENLMNPAEGKSGYRVRKLPQ